jgi:tripartite-type tricarboxylate transporter receptor subunit TctC
VRRADFPHNSGRPRPRGRRVTPYAPGGTTDILARLLAAPLLQSLGQPFLIESRPGAGGNDGTDMVAKSPGDGYTILMGASGPLAINVTLFKALPYDPTTDLVPVVHVASVPLILVAHPSFPARAVRKLLDLLKARPDAYSHASAGADTRQRLLDLGSADVAGSPEQFGGFIEAEIAKWGKVVKASGASAD